jgi:signal recognition particle receptor subunit beta
LPVAGPGDYNAVGLMVLFNHATKELTAKVVYYGPGLCGKTTNLQWVHEKLPIKNKGKMLSLATETDRTLFFDFLPIELGTIRGMKTRVQLYTVPGQVFYNATRRMVLRGADCVVFVADSQEAMIEANLESLENLRQNLEANEIDTDEIPMVLQYNKRDLPNALPIEILNERLNPKGVPFNEAVAIKGIGVEETLKAATGLVFRSLAAKYGGAEAQAAAARPAPPVAAPALRPPQPPPPAPAAAPARAGMTTLPPLNVRPAAPEPEVLDSLELTPEPESEDLDLSPPPPPAPVSAGRVTMVRGGQDAEDLRRRIGRPGVPEVSLEQIEDEEGEEEITELSLEPEAEPEPEPAPPPQPTPRPVPPVTAVTTRPPSRPTPAPSPAPAPATAQVVAPARVVTAPPVQVYLQAVPGQTAVAIPVEVSLQGGSATVTIQLQLTLHLKQTP